MQRLTVLLAILALGCQDHVVEPEPLPEVGVTDPVVHPPVVAPESVIPEVASADPSSLIPEVASADPSSLIPEVTPAEPPVTRPHRGKDTPLPVVAPDYDKLAGMDVGETGSGKWVVRGTPGAAAYGSMGYLEDGEAAFDDLGGYASGPAVSRKAESRAPAVRGRPVSSADVPSMAPMMEGGGYGSDDYTAMPTSNPLRAGTTDDNEAFGAYLEFLATWTDRGGMAGSYAPTDVRDRQYVQVTDSTGIPLPGAAVEVSSGGAFQRIGSTYGDGTVPFFPHLMGDASGHYTVRVRYGEERISVVWDGQAPLRIGLDQAIPEDQVVPLDVAFVIDTTGSMSDEIDRIKSTLLSVTAQIRSSERPVDLRYGAVLYRDIGDEYITMRHPFTKDIEAFDAELKGIYAGGGGDGPESLNQGLAETVYGLEWRQDSAKIAFLIADAPPHMDYQGDVTYAQTALGAVAKGIRIHTVAASGLDGYGGTGSLVFRQTAQLAQGRFIFIEYGTVEASAASHGVTGPVQSNNLDHIIVEQVTKEIDGWRRISPLIASL